MEIILAKTLGVPHWGHYLSFIVWGKVTTELCLAQPPGTTLIPMILSLLSCCSSFCTILWSLFLEPSIALGMSVWTASGLLCLHWNPAVPRVATSPYVALSRRFLPALGSPQPFSLRMICDHHSVSASPVKVCTPPVIIPFPAVTSSLGHYLTFLNDFAIQPLGLCHCLWPPSMPVFPLAPWSVGLFPLRPWPPFPLELPFKLTRLNRSYQLGGNYLRVWTLLVPSLVIMGYSFP